MITRLEIPANIYQEFILHLVMQYNALHTWSHFYLYNNLLASFIFPTWQMSRAQVHLLKYAVIYLSILEAQLQVRCLCTCQPVSKFNNWLSSPQGSLQNKVCAQLQVTASDKRFLSGESLFTCNVQILLCGASVGGKTNHLNKMKKPRCFQYWVMNSHPVWEFTKDLSHICRGKLNISDQS